MSLREIGKKLKVSRFTVARVLREDKYVSEKTRALVLDYLKKEPYAPNIHSARLLSGKINVLGLLFFGGGLFSMEPYVQEIIKGVSEAAKKEGYQVMLFTQDKFNSFECLNTYLNKSVSGFILPAIGKDNYKDVLGLQDKKVPLVLLCSHLKDLSSFDCDNVTGGYLATKYLLDSGRKRIAFIHGHKNWVDAEDRFKGYKKALQEADKQVIIEYNDDNNHINYEKLTIERLLSLKEPPDAVFAANDRMALAAMSAIKQAGRDIPKDIAVIGFDNIPSCENFSPSLSTVSQPVKDMAFAAAETLIKNVIPQGKNKDYTRFFEPKLVIRKST
ncbi:MAG: LacI family DNA-binding transcriptional regulator [Candidatus Omnitrophica bacterium]|nr:LacI family DNA-binding transcriptional regulator [Candidatus Omnitrophota bacterium]MDD5546991.1 LacI family DNA-binding transcriptional regulator [Candidatus Omnitrophota bacterium]